MSAGERQVGTAHSTAAAEDAFFVEEEAEIDDKRVLDLRGGLLAESLESLFEGVFLNALDPEFLDVFQLFGTDDRVHRQVLAFCPAANAFAVGCYAVQEAGGAMFIVAGEESIWAGAFVLSGGILEIGQELDEILRGVVQVAVVRRVL